MRRRFAIVSGVVAFTATLSAQPATERSSPFLPPKSAGTAPATAAPAGSHDFTGVIVAGKEVLVSLTDTQAKRSFWIGVGKSVDQIEVLSYDPRGDVVVVRVNGETRRLTLKQPVVAATAGNVVATVPVAPTVPLAPLPPPATPAEAEREARMLVSDLLEIGMQQRKAYEEAQKKAAEEAAKKTPPAPPPPKS